MDYLESLDIQELFKDIMKDTAKDTFSFMKSTMFEEIMGFQADEQEFMLAKSRNGIVHLWLLML